MTKIGEGVKVPTGPSDETNRRQLEQAILHFQNALNSYPLTMDEEKKNYLQTTMKQQLELIKGSIDGIRRSGIEKQGNKVQSDYERYVKDPSTENYTVLEQDLSTLKEYSTLPTIHQERDESTSKKTQ